MHELVVSSAQEGELERTSRQSRSSRSRFERELFWSAQGEPAI